MRTLPYPVMHPAYCDPRCCASNVDEHGQQTTDHRSGPLELQPVSGDDVILSVGLARFDLDHEIATGDDVVRFDLTPGWGDGKPIGADLTATDARLLAAALQCAADQLDAAGPALPKQRDGGAR